MILLDRKSFNKACEELMPLRRNMSTFDGDKFPCACGTEHTFFTNSIVVIGEGWSGRFMIECPINSQYKSLIQTDMKFGFIYRGLKLLAGWNVEEV